MLALIHSWGLTFIEGSLWPKKLQSQNEKLSFRSKTLPFHPSISIRNKWCNGKKIIRFAAYQHHGDQAVPWVHDFIRTISTFLGFDCLCSTMPDNCGYCIIPQPQQVHLCFCCKWNKLTMNDPGHNAVFVATCWRMMDIPRGQGSSHKHFVNVQRDRSSASNSVKASPPVVASIGKPMGGWCEPIWGIHVSS